MKDYMSCRVTLPLPDSHNVTTRPLLREIWKYAGSNCEMIRSVLNGYCIMIISYCAARILRHLSPDQECECDIIMIIRLHATSFYY